MSQAAKPKPLPPRMTYTRGGFWHWLCRGPRGRIYLGFLLAGIVMFGVLFYFWGDPETTLTRVLLCFGLLAMGDVGKAYWEWRFGGWRDVPW